MVLAALQNAGQLVFLSLSALVIFFTLRRNWRRSRANAGQSVVAEVKQEHRALETNASYVHDMQVRLYDYSRDVEGRLQTTLATLDTLVEEADREIQRLDELLQTCDTKKKPPRTPDIVFPATTGRITQAANEPSSSVDEELADLCSGAIDDTQTMVLLGDAGYSPKDIADYMKRPLAEVLVILESRRRHDRDAA